MADRPKKPLRRLWIVLGIVAAIVTYGLAVDQTGVSLDEITSESRQEQLVRIIRALAQPELVTFDFEQTNTDVEFSIPCDGNDGGPTSNGGVTITPGCGDPEDVVTVTGTGFDPFTEGRVIFVPESDFDVTIPLEVFEADSGGDFSVEVTLPDRPSESTQIMRVVVPERLGTWGDREEVWTDTNENGIRDLGVIGPDGLQVTVENVSPEVPAAALLDATNQVTQFVTSGNEFLAVEGPARGTNPTPIDEASGEIEIESLDVSGSSTVVTVTGPEGTDLSSWRVAIYDATTGEAFSPEFLGDQIELSPRVSEQTLLTIDEIVDTVFLALVATTAGLTIALPLSFIAARNLMRDVSTTVIGLGMGLISVPVGVWLGLTYVDGQRTVLGDSLDNIPIMLGLIVVGGAVSFFLARQIFFGREGGRTLVRASRSFAAMVATALTLEGLFALLTEIGDALREPFGVFDFVPGLFATMGEVGTVLLPIVIGLVAASILIGLASKASFWLVSHLSGGARALVGYTLMAVAGALVAALIGAAIDWLYQIANPNATLVIPAIVGATLGLIAAFLGRQRGEIKIGLTVYYIARTVFNTLRSIEPLVMVIVFVVWVGFGEFAGSLALALHTAAALAKLYSEQVESISEGPLEAVRATGANRLQSTIYAVVPQIIPPYIAFTMYRWDINVRMSTILGFAGGGGIGFLLNQNVQLGDFRAAAVQMLAIAIVVASMDYASSRLRERFT